MRVINLDHKKVEIDCLQKTLNRDLNKKLIKKI